MTTFVPSHIEIDSKGSARITGKGFKVHVLAALYNQGWSVEDFVEQYDLTPAEIHAGLSYYYDHKDEIDRANREGDEQVKQIGVSGEELINRLKGRKTARDDNTA
jgi:uncharacterized protein (DUF433 family)